MLEEVFGVVVLLEVAPHALLVDEIRPKRDHAVVGGLRLDEPAELPVGGGLTNEAPVLVR